MEKQRNKAMILKSSGYVRRKSNSLTPCRAFGSVQNIHRDIWSIVNIKPDLLQDSYFNPPT